ncbi:hypothetical protein [Joostella sp. CR20]|uniref:hypothetical protein n=1 Tax=Joostella sp. CR20 TaxID=2804312 RepID=UPI00313BB232
MIIKSDINKIRCIALGLVVGWVFGACSDIVKVPDITQDKVIVIAPAHQTTVKGNVVNFTWEPLADADSYLLQVASPNFEQASQVYVDSLLVETSFEKELLPNDYQWRVKAINSAYETLYSYSSFSVRKSDGFEGNTVLLTNPVNAHITNQTSINFVWEALEEAVAYQFQVLDSSGVVVAEETIEDTSIELSLEEGNLTWQVKATNSDDESTLYSSRTILIDRTNPNTPQLLTPANNSTEVSGELTWTWERENSIGGSVEIDSIFIYNDENQTSLYKKGIGSEKSYQTTIDIGSYYWKVTAYDLANNKSDDSAVFELVVN